MTIKVENIMSINIQARGFRLTSALRDYVSNKLEKVAQRYRHQVPKIAVTLQDINGPRGGEDMRCKILLTIDGQRSVVVQETADDMYDAIAVATSRAAWVVNRQFERLQDKKRKIFNRHQVAEFGTPDDIDELPAYAGAVESYHRTF